MKLVLEGQVIQIACQQLESPFQDCRTNDRILKEEDSGSESDGSESDTFFELYYLRRSYRMSAFLQQDTSLLFEDDAASTDISTSPAQSTSTEPTEHTLHRYIPLQHPGVDNSRFYFDPAFDVIWLGDEIELESVKELLRFYGSQLNSIENAIVEEIGLWDDIDKALRVMDVFGGLRTVYVWLESYCFKNGVPLTTGSGYLDQAREFEARDRAALQGRTLMVEYIDHDSNTYGGFRSGAVPERTLGSS